MTAARTLANLNASALSNVDINSTGNNNIPLFIDAASGQSADLAQFRNSAGSVISRVNSSGQFVSPGNTVQFINIRSDVQTSYAHPTSGNGTEISALNMTITPKYANSKLLIQWEIGYESNYNGSFLIWKNGSLLSNGYNSVTGNQLYSGYATTAYDVDVASTPNRNTITFIDSPGATTATTYSLAIRGHEAGTLWLNRAFGSVPSNGNEAQVSLGYIMEIAQ